MEAILVDALGNQILQGAAYSSLLRGNRFIRGKGGPAELLAEPVTLTSIYGRALFLAPVLPTGCFLSAHSAAWVWAGNSTPPETIYIASLRRPRRAADSRYWIHLDARSRHDLKEKGILPLGSSRTTFNALTSAQIKNANKGGNDFIRLGPIKLLSPLAVLRFCDHYPQLPGQDSWDRSRLLSLANKLFTQSAGGASSQKYPRDLMNIV